MMPVRDGGEGQVGRDPLGVRDLYQESVGVSEM